MWKLILIINLASASWPEKIRKEYYMNCLAFVPDFQNGVLENAQEAHEMCVCIVNILEEHIEQPSDELLGLFLETKEAENLLKCRPKKWKSPKK